MIYFYLCVSVWVYVNVKCVQAPRDQKVSNPLEQQLEVVMSHWMLGTLLWYSERAASTLSHLVTRPFLQPRDYMLKLETINK